MKTIFFLFTFLAEIDPDVVVAHGVSGPAPVADKVLSRGPGQTEYSIRSIDQSEDSIKEYDQSEDSTWL